MTALEEIQRTAKVLVILSQLPRSASNRQLGTVLVQRMRGLMTRLLPTTPTTALALVPERPIGEHETHGAKSLLLEILRRAAADWVLYRTSTRLQQKQIAEEAFYWLFKEGKTGSDVSERSLSGKQLTSFLAICEALEFDPELVRARVRQLTPQQIVGMGRPAEFRKIPVQRERLLPKK